MDHSIRLWNFPKRERILTRQGHLSEVWTVAFSPDGSTLVSGAKDGVKLWPIREQPKDDSLPGTWQPLAISKDSRSLAALNRQGAITFWNLATGELLTTLRQEMGPVYTIAFSRAGDLLASGGSEGEVRLWPAAPGDQALPRRK